MSDPTRLREPSAQVTDVAEPEQAPDAPAPAPRRRFEVGPLILALLPVLGLAALLLRGAPASTTPEEALVPVIPPGATAPGVFHPTEPPTTSARAVVAPEGTAEAAPAAEAPPAQPAPVEPPPVAQAPAEPAIPAGTGQPTPEGSAP